MKDMIDLTYDIEESMSVFNAYWHPKIQITQMGKHDSEGRETRKLILGTHSGTHIDAPSHFVKDGTTIDQIQLSRLIGPITIVDFSELKDNQMVNLEMIKIDQLSDLQGWNILALHIKVKGGDGAPARVCLYR